jgi:hypothetical protein
MYVVISPTFTYIHSEWVYHVGILQRGRTPRPTLLKVGTMFRIFHAYAPMRGKLFLYHRRSLCQSNRKALLLSGMDTPERSESELRRDLLNPDEP